MTLNGWGNASQPFFLVFSTVMFYNKKSDINMTGSVL